MSRSWLCRHGWHTWRFVSMADRHEVNVPGLFVPDHCTLIERCQRCGLKRTRPHAEVPTRVKVYEEPPV